MDPGQCYLERVRQINAPQLKITTSEMMKQELGEYPSFNFHQQRDLFRDSVVSDILSVRGNDNNESISRKSIQLFSQAGKSSLVDQKVLIDSSLDSKKTTIISNPRVGIRKQQRIIQKVNKHPSQWNAEYHLTMRSQKCVRNATVYASNQDEVILKVEKDMVFRRQSCEFESKDQLGTKQKRFANIIVEIQMHKKRRIANKLIQSLKKSKQVSTFGKHQNILKIAKWAYNTKADHNYLDSPIIKRSSSNEEDFQKENKKEILSVPDQELGQRIRRSIFKTIQLPDKMTSFKFLDIPVDKNNEEKDKFITPLILHSKKKKLNNAQMQVYQLKFHTKCRTEMSPLNPKSADITPKNKDLIYHSTYKNDLNSRQKKIVANINKQCITYGVSSAMQLFPKRKDSLFKSLRIMTEQKSSDMIFENVDSQKNKKISLRFVESPLNSPTIFKMHRKHISFQMSKI